jgi:hypothetical protein
MMPVILCAIDDLFGSVVYAGVVLVYLLLQKMNNDATVHAGRSFRQEVVRYTILYKLDSTLHTSGFIHITIIYTYNFAWD